MNNKTAIVTGGGRGIGLGIAYQLAIRGYRLALADIDANLAHTSAEQLAEKSGTEVIGLSCNVADKTSVQSCVDSVEKQFGGVDILVNNAGICPFEDVMQMEEDVFRKTLDVNLTGAFFITQLVANMMISSKTRGRIVFITSLAVKQTNFRQVDYAASKAGLNMLMKGFAVALGPHGITCNAVAPGWIYTDLTKHHWDIPENLESAQKRIPLGRLGMPDDIGKAVAFLASDDSDYVNGTTILLDGGLTANTG